MSKLYRIEEEDLAELERTLPAFADALFTTMDGALRVKFRRVQKIISDVRWSYGPPSHVERVIEESDNTDSGYFAS